MEKNYDICGWATKFNVKCADGRTIRPGAFKDCDGMKVPLVWQHMHDDPGNVLGHAILSNKDEGVYTYCYFNDSKAAEDAKELIRHGDINSFSIYANKLKHKGGDVLHGTIREVSLVLAGANPEALIEFPVLEHGDGEPCEDEAVIYSHGEIARPDTNYVPFVPVQMPVIPQPVLMHTAVAAKAPAPAQPKQEVKNMPERTVKDVFNEFTDEQKNVVYFLLGEMLDEFGGSEDSEMKHNAFEGDTPATVLSHDDMKAIFENAKRSGSLKAAAEDYFASSDSLAHAVYNSDGTEQTYGVADIDTLFPEYRNLNNPPDWIKRDQDWVGVVMNGVHKTPFSRIKSQFANITMDEARAKGYVKGRRKIEEVFSLLRRTTDPQTVYKKQKLDRDDILDITDFDIVRWIKGEMRLMLDEEIARAILIGDGRLATDEDKISDQHIRPIWGDDELYTIRVNVVPANGDDDAAKAKKLIRAIIKARKNYKGSGNLIFFTSEDWLTEMLLLEDGIGHPLYADSAALARKLRVNRIVSSPIMEGQAKGNEELVGVIVDLNDYNVGADKGAGVELFDDFDIDYNQYKYLIETRISGALTKPFSAMAVTMNGANYTYSEVADTTGKTPVDEGWYEKQGTLYRPTADTTVVSGKTYYEKTAE